MNRVVTGTYTGTGAALNLAIGFIPAKLEVYNDTDGDDVWIWIKGMAAAAAFYANATGDRSKITSNGITAYAGSRGTDAAGVTIGSALSESGKTFRYIAYRED